MPPRGGLPFGGAMCNGRKEERARARARKIEKARDPLWCVPLILPECPAGVSQELWQGEMYIKVSRCFECCSEKPKAPRHTFCSAAGGPFGAGQRPTCLIVLFVLLDHWGDVQECPGTCTGRMTALVQPSQCSSVLRHVSKIRKCSRRVMLLREMWCRLRQTIQCSSSCLAYAKPLLGSPAFASSWIT